MKSKIRNMKYILKKKKINKYKKKKIKKKKKKKKKKKINKYQNEIKNKPSMHIY